MHSMCRQPSHRIAERLPELVGHYARGTNRLDSWLTGDCQVDGPPEALAAMKLLLHHRRWAR
jgi:hypothetical protein